LTVDDGCQRTAGATITGSKGPSDKAGVVRLWDMRTGRLLLTLSTQARPGVRPAFSRDGRLLLVGDKGGAEVLFDGLTGQELRRFKSEAGGTAKVAALAPDGKRVVTAGAGPGHATLWDAESGKVVADLAGPEGVSFACFDAGGTRVVTLAGREAFVWDAGTGAAVCVCKGHEADTLAAAFSPDGGRLLTGSADRTAALWDTASGGLLAVYVGHPGPVRLVAFSPTGLQVAAVSDDAVARLWPIDLLPAAAGRASRGLTPDERLRFTLPAPD
jgi:WD40 repeat protein